MNNICAVKRDVCRILEMPYPVDLLQFKVDVISSNTPLLKEQLYSIKQEGLNYYLYHLITKLNFYIKISSSIEFWHEGMTVSILDTNDVKVGTGCLIHEGVDMNKALTKEEILASDCIIKSEYQTLFDNALDTQLIPEKYLLKPNDPPASVTFYYDSRYLSVTRLNLSIYEIEEVEGSYSDLSERQVDQQVSPFNQKSSSKSYIVCQIGDILLVEEKEHPDYEYGYLIIGGIWDYNSTSNVELIKSNETASLSFEITLDCFATFTIYSPKYKITASVPGGYIAPIDGELIAILPDGYDFGFTLLAEGTTTPLYAKQGQEINLTMELTNYPSDVSQGTLHYISPIVTVTYLENGVSTAKNLTSNIFTDTETTSECSFTMPASDCHITVQLRLTGEGADQYVDPTEGESGYALFVTGNIESVIINGFYDTIPATVIALDKVNVSFTRKLGHSYTYSLYYTASGTTIKSGVIFSDYIEVDVLGNLTLNILELETDCVYTSATGKLSLDENWDNDNPIIGHNYYNNRSYTVDTENPLQTSGINNNFRNKSITGITFNSTNDLFHIYNNAFKDCNILINTSINGPKSISVGSSSFENTTSLRFADWTENITRLSEKSFKHSGILEYSSNPDITNIPKLAFLNCYRLESVSLHNSNLTSIEECAFENCSNLLSISIPKCIQGINKYAFRYSGIPSITTSSSAQLLGGCTFITDSISPEISVIKEGVFQGCKNLKNIYLPDSIEHLETLSFAECNNIQNFSSPGLKTVALGAFKDTWVEKQQYFNQLKPSRSNYDNDSVRYKDDTSGVYFKFIDRVDLPLTHVALIKPNPEEESYILYNRNGLLAGVGNMYYIPENISSISDYGFAKNDVLDYVDPYDLWFGEGNSQELLRYPIKHIGDYAFKDCGAGLIGFNASELEHLGIGAFYNCRVLRELKGFSNAPLTVLPAYTFYNCGGDRWGLGWNQDDPTLYTFSLPTNIEEIGDYAFYNCRQLMGIANHAICPIRKIGKYAFANCFRNTHNIWDAVESSTVFAIKLAVTIYSYCYCFCPNSFSAFEGGVSVASVYLTSAQGTCSVAWRVSDIFHLVLAAAGSIETGTSLATNWKDDDDSYIGSLSDVIKKSVKAAETRSSLVLDRVTEIGEGAFLNCNYLGYVAFNKDMTKIPDFAFQNCRRLLGLGFADRVNWNEFNMDSLFCEPNIKTIGKYSFSGCKKLLDACVNDLLKHATIVKEGAFKNSKVSYSSYQDDYGQVDAAIMIPATLTVLEKESLGFNGENRFYFINDNPNNALYNPNAFEGANTSKLFLYVPEGSKSYYLQVFPQVHEKNIAEISKSDAVWTTLKDAGYTIPWLTD